MNKDQEPANTEQKTESGKEGSYVKVIVIFSVVMTVLLLGLNYLFKYIV